MDNFSLEDLDKRISSRNDKIRSYLELFRFRTNDLEKYAENLFLVPEYSPKIRRMDNQPLHKYSIGSKFGKQQSSDIFDNASDRKWSIDSWETEASETPDNFTDGKQEKEKSTCRVQSQLKVEQKVS